MGEEMRTVTLTMAVLETTFPDEGALSQFVLDALIAWQGNTDYPKVIAAGEHKGGPEWLVST